MAQDDTLESGGEEPVFKADDYGFNAIDLRQSRFMYSDLVPYLNKKFYDNMSVGMVWHIDKIHERVSPGFVPALNYGLYVEKDINKLHSLRLLVYEGVYQQAQRSIRMNKYQAELLYSFNWTRYFGGYNPYRKVEAVTSLGVGAFYSKRLEDVEKGPLFVMGAGARMLLSPEVALSVEPYVALASDNVDFSENKNFRNYDVLYGADVSLSYTFHEQEFREKLRRRYAGKAFVDFGLGTQFEPFVGYYRRDNAIPFFATGGPHLRLGIGYWLEPGLAIRATGNLSSSDFDANDDQSMSDIRLKNVLTNGRLDLLFSPYRYFKGLPAHRFDVLAVLGWEYGHMIKTAYDPGELLRTHYDGFSAGLQFRYNYDPNTTLYVEPGITLANYNVPYAPPYEDYEDHYRDYLFSLTAGLEYAVNEYRFLGKNRQPSKFSPHISLSMLGGSNYLFVTKEHADKFSIDYSAGIAGDMQITPYSGVRLMADYSRLSYRDDSRVTGRYGFVDVSADYVFNLGTLLQGYNENKRWDVALAAGPVYSRRVNETFVSAQGKLDNYAGRALEEDLGAQIGIPVSYRLTPRLDLMFEPRARFFGKDYISQGHSQGPTKIINAQLGLRYSINERYYVPSDSLDVYFKAKPGHLFAHMGVGAQSSQSWGDMGPRVEAGLGYWFNPGVAARASLNLASHDWKRFQSPFENSLRQVSAGGRLDLMLAPFDYIANRYDRLFGMNFIFGWEYGKMLRGNLPGKKPLNDNYNAISGGFQLRYNDDSHHALYVEPRYTYNLTSKSSYYSLVAGMELGATEYAFHSNKYQPGEFSPSLSFSLLGGLGYIYNGKEYTDAPISDYTGGIAAEYKFSPYSGVRLTASYANYHQRGLYRHQDVAGHSLHNYSVDYMNFGLDYVFDIATLLQGYTSDRRWNAALAVGPTLGYKVAESETISREGYIPLTPDGVSYSEQARSGFWGMQVGIPVSYSIDDNWAIMFEPRLKASVKHLFNTTTRYPFMQYDALLGMKYTPDEQLYARLKELNESHDSRYDFVDYAMGIQYAAGTGLPFGSTGGVQLGLGLGRWFNPLLGVRFGGEIAAYHLSSKPFADYDLLLKSARIGGRADMLLNPLAFSGNYTPNRFGMALLLGWELGGKIDAKYTHLDAHFYNSLSVGAQLRMRTDENHTLYIEPRYAVDDRLVSVTAGLEYAMTEHRFRSSKNQPGEFNPYYNIGVAGGFSYRFLSSLRSGMPQLGVTAGLSGEYHFTPYSGTRFTADYAEVTNGTTTRVGHVNTGFDYMFDLSTLFAGYTPDRRMNVSLAAGPVFSTRASESNDQLTESSIGAQVGIPVLYRLNDNLGISLEPRAQAFFNRNYAALGGGRSAIVNLQMGVKYTPGERFYNHMDKLNESHDARYDFVNYAMGIQYATGTGLSFGSTGGVQLGLGVGRWINSLLGVRLGGEIAASHLRSVQPAGYDLLLKSARFSGRADVMVNPLALANNYTPNRFGTALLLGWELGGKIDAKYTDLDTYFYNSLSVGAQLRMRTDENHTLYIEPRYTLDDRFVSLTAGLEYAMTEHRFRSSNRQPGEFSPYYNVGIAGGFSHRFLTNIAAGMPQLGVNVGMSGEYHFTPYSGARITADYAEVTNGTTTRVGHVNTGLDYMFDLSTLFAGYTPDRRLDVSLAAGPVLSTKASEGNEQLAGLSVGAQVGIPVQYRLNDNLGISLEPRAQAFFNEDYAALGGGRSAIVNLQMGVKYTPDERYYVRAKSAERTRGSRYDFVNYAMGLQYAAGTGMNFGHTGGIQLGAGFGRWMNSLLGVRFGAEMAASHLRSVQPAGYDLLLKSARFSGRADVLLNPLAFSGSYTPGRIGTALLLGWELGGKIDAKYTHLEPRFYSSLSVGAQLRLLTDENHAFYIEPRYTVDDRLVSVTAGLEYAMTEHRFRSGRRQPGVFKPYYNIGVAGGVSHRFLTNIAAGMPQLGVAAGLSGEYHFTPYSGARFTADYAEVTNGTATRVGHVNTGFDYMFDLSTLFAGYTPERRLDVSLAAGPVFSTRAAGGSEQLAKSSVGAQVGVPVQYRLSNNWGISLEPRALAFFNRNYAALGGGRSAIANLQMGVKYTPGEKMYNRMKKLNESYSTRYDFVNYSMGLQYAAGTGMNFGHTGGMQLGLSLGRWFNSLMGVRFGGEIAAYHLSSKSFANYDLLLKSTRFSGRADMLLNPLAFNGSYTPGRFGTALLLGWELGGKIDAKYTHLEPRFYNSLSVGAQLRMRTDENHTLYIEPRYAFDDRLVSMTAGLEFAMTEHRFYSSSRQPGEFTPYYNIGVAGGVSHRFLTSIAAGMPQVGANVGLSGEYHFTPYSGARITADYAEVTNGSATRVGHVNTGLDYMFDLSTLFAGYTPERRLDVSLALGPVFSFAAKGEHIAKSSVGVQAGIPVQFHLGKNLGISLEPRAHAFFNRNYAALGGGRSAIANLLVGVKYTF